MIYADRDEPVMLACSLQSGSNGNCIYVETPDARLLFDAGISAKLAQERLAFHQRRITGVDALILSHNHSDHVRGAGAFHRKFHLPLFLTERVLARCRESLGPLGRIEHFLPGDTLHFGDTEVVTVPTPHDGIDTVAFVVRRHGKSLGIFIDLGHRFAGIETQIAPLDGLFLESNYDPDLLARSNYPTWLKQRIRGPGGHLSNEEAAELVRDCAGDLQFLALAHLSEHNNRPKLALETARDILSSHMPITLASRHCASDMHLLR